MSSTLISASSCVAPRLERLQLLLRQLAHVRILEQLLGGGDLCDDGLVFTEGVDQRLHLGERLRVRAELRRVGLDRGIGHLGHQLLVPGLDGPQFVEHMIFDPAAAAGSASRHGRQKRDLVAVLQRARSCARSPRSPRTTRCAAYASSSGMPSAQRSSRRPAPCAPSGTSSRSSDAPAISRSRANSRTVTSMPARRRPARAASSCGSAVAPSIQTSPPSKCSCFQIGVICLIRSIA